MAPPPHLLHSVGETKRAHYYAYGVIVFLAFVVLRYVYQTLTSPLRRVPGPLLARFTRLWELQAIRKHENAALNIALHEKYGQWALCRFIRTTLVKIVQFEKPY